MTSVVSSPPRSAPRASAKPLRLRAAAARVVFVTSILCATAAGFAATGGAEEVQAASGAGPDLVRLMHFMVLVKAAMAAAVTAAVVWRLGAGIGTTRMLAYGVSGALMAGGLGLIWDMVYVGAGAALLHGGLIGTMVILWRDPETGRCLERALHVRRRQA